MKTLTAREWQEISDLWSQRPRSVTITQLRQRYGAPVEHIKQGLIERGHQVKFGADEQRIPCACGCGVTVGRTHRHAAYQGQVFRNLTCVRRFRGRAEERAKAKANPGIRRSLQTMVKRSVPVAVWKSWPKTWCVDRHGDTIRVWRSPQDRARALVTGTLIIPLLVVHTKDRSD